MKTDPVSSRAAVLLVFKVFPSFSYSGLENMDMAAMTSAKAILWIPAESYEGVSVSLRTSMIFEFVLEWTS